MIIDYWEKHYTENIMEIEDIMFDLKEIAKNNKRAIVCINYDLPMGYTIESWDSKDILNVYRGEN